MSDVNYRDAVPADAVLLETLSRRSFAETFGHLYTPDNLDAFLSRLNTAEWRSELEDPAFLARIVEADGEPIAFAHELMAWAIAEAKRRGACDLYLSVFVDNHRARRFYEGYGFTFIGTYAFMVGEHEDEDHVLRLELDSR
jgi:GNAT superfamily N-acetyltransferase